MIPFMDSRKEMDNKCLDSQLWHACAGGMVQMPPTNSAVFYFPQGHAEHACQNPTIDFRNYPKIPPFVMCRVCSVKFMADPDTDEVYSKIGLIPMMNPKEHDFEDVGMLLGLNGNEGIEKPASFAKTLTQSDANNGGGFSVPRYCAEMIFPRLDYNADPPVQTILAKDVHGETWKFRHIYRGTPRRHLLTTGWSNFVNHKKLVAGDSIVFLRAENGELRVGIRRAKRGLFGESPAGWNCAISCNGFSSYLSDNENHLMKKGNAFNGNLGKVRCESVLEAATLASNGQPFEVVYYPRASTPEFCVKASLVKAALQIRWCSGMRFKMAFETEDSSRISWFMGTISSVQVADPIRWPDSPWRLLQVTWDEPDLLQNVKRVSPWLVESVSNMASMQLSPFLPPNKKFKLSDHPEFPIDGHLKIPPWFNCQPNNTPAGMQGARHAHSNRIGTISLSDFHLSKFQSSLFTKSPSCPIIHQPSNSSSENVSCKLTMGNSSQTLKKNEDVKAPQLVLFGQPILTEQQISQTGNSSSDRNLENRSETGAIKHVGDESFRDFAKTTKPLTIQKDSSGDNLGL